MKSTVETLSPTRVRLAIEVPFAELEASLKRAYKEIGSQVTIPGFRKGKVPSAVIDQRVGRGTILSEAVQGAIPEQFLAAVREHEVRTIGRPEVEITDFADGQPLKFTAEIDVRPEITLPDLTGFEVTVDALEISDEDVSAQVDGLRQRFATLKTVDRPASRGDFVQLDLAATVDGEEVPGGAANTFTSALVAGDYAGRDAEVSVTVRTVKERELPPVDDDFAQMASEFDTLDELRADLAQRLGRVRRMEQVVAARDKALDALVAAADVPAPEGVLRDEVDSRKQQMTDQLERMGATLEDYLTAEEKTEDELTADLTAAAQNGVKVQLLLDAFADAEEITVTDDEFGHEVVHRAQRAQMAPQQYYDQLVRAGLASSVAVDVRRGKALSTLLEKITIKDTDGNVISLDELRGADEDHTGHDHD